MKKVIAAGTAIAGIALSATPAWAVGTLDYSIETDKAGYAQVLCTTDDGTYTTEWGVIYPAATSGQLDRAEFWVPMHNGSASSYTLEVRTVENGLPTETVLATEELTWDELSPHIGGYVPIDFASPAVVTAGDTYAVTWRLDFASCSQYHSMALSTGSDDAYGAVWSQNDAAWSIASGVAMEFRAYVTAAEDTEAEPEVTDGAADDELATTGVDETFGPLAWGAIALAATAVFVSRRRS